MVVEQVVVRLAMVVLTLRAVGALRGEARPTVLASLGNPAS